MNNEQKTIERKGHLGGTPARLGNYRTRHILYISIRFLWAIALYICKLSLFPASLCSTLDIEYQLWIYSFIVFVLILRTERLI